jgi:Domain of unknown function (DUF4114)
LTGIDPALVSPMRKQAAIKILVAIGGLLLTFEAKAVLTPVNPLGEGDDPSLSLQSLIDARGNTLVNINSDADQLDDGLDVAWTSTAGNPVAMVVEVAGSASVNTFGVYNLADPSQKTEIFLGVSTGGATSTILSPYATFGFYLYNGALNQTWYSDTSLNGGQDHMVAYQGKGQTLNLGNDPNNPTGSVLWDSNTYLLAWEDVNLPDSDYDYNDMVLLVNTATSPDGSKSAPVSDRFTTAGLLGMAIMGLAFFRRHARLIENNQESSGQFR